MEHFGAINVLLNSAGINIPSQTIDDQGNLLDLKTFRMVWEINVFGTVYAIKHATKHMIR